MDQPVDEPTLPARYPKAEARRAAEGLTTQAIKAPRDQAIRSSGPRTLRGGLLDPSIWFSTGLVRHTQAVRILLDGDAFQTQEPRSPAGRGPTGQRGLG